MTLGNLIPMYRRRARHRRRLARRWAVVTAGYLGLLVAAYPFAHALVAVDETLGEQLSAVQQEIATRQSDIAMLEARVDETRATLNATRMVENQADWSVLLGIIVEEMGEDIVLRECVLEPMVPVNAGSGTKRPGVPGAASAPESVHLGVAPERYETHLRGYGRTQLAVSQFVLRLERAGLFTMVTLEESRREGFLGGDAISFRLRCVLARRKEPPT